MRDLDFAKGNDSVAIIHAVSCLARQMQMSSVTALCGTCLTLSHL